MLFKFGFLLTRRAARCRKFNSYAELHVPQNASNCDVKTKVGRLISLFEYFQGE